jgi:hypothetical protein
VSKVTKKHDIDQMPHPFGFSRFSNVDNSFRFVVYKDSVRLGQAKDGLKGSKLLKEKVA